MKWKIFALITFILMAAPLSAGANAVFSFDGELDFTKKKLDLVAQFQDESSLRTNITKTDDHKFHVSLKLDHVQTPFFDVSSDIESMIEVSKHKNDHGYALSGKLWSSYSLIDYKPIRELSGRFEVKDQRLILDELSFGNVRCNGFVSLESPHKLDLTFDLNGIGMDDFLDFWIQEKGYLASGTVEGSVKAAGTVDNLFLKGLLQSYNGFIKNLDYDSIHLNVEGYYPRMQVVQATLSKSDGVSFTFEGPFDLSDSENFKKQVKALTISPLVQDSERESEWTIKRLQPEGAASTELKYLLRKSTAADNEDAGMFGIERTVEF